MSVTPIDSREDLHRSKSRLYGTIGLMAVSAVVLSASVIIYSHRTSLTDNLTSACTSLELAAVTFLPYMISAAVAAITAIGILAMAPMRGIYEPASEIRARLRQLACGDLFSRLQVKRKDHQLTELVGELNNTVGVLGQQIAEWKLMNRRQWDILQRAHQAVAGNDCDQAKRYIEQMEVNWQKIAEIEQKLVT